MRTLTIILLLAGIITLDAQVLDKSLSGPYLGQKAPELIPEIFAPGIISTEKGWEAAISFSTDLSELFFSYRGTIDGAENRVMHMKMVNNVWTKPKLAPFAQDIMEYEAFITGDPDIYITKARDGSCGL